MITYKLKDLIGRMERAKKTTEWAFDNCPQEEKQNIIWMDCRIEFWLKDLRDILVEAKRDE